MSKETSMSPNNVALVAIAALIVGVIALVLVIVNT